MKIKMPVKKTVIMATIMIAFLGVCLAGACAADLVPLTDDEMDEIFAQGIFVDININIAMPNGSNLAMPSFEVPFPDIPSMQGHTSDGTSGSISVAPVDSTASAPVNNLNSADSSGHASSGLTVAAANPDATSRTGSGNTLIMPTASAVSIGDNSMTDNSGLIITAPGAAISILLNVAVFNNSTLNGDFMQSASSNVRTFSFAFSSFNF